MAKKIVVEKPTMSEEVFDLLEEELPSFFKRSRVEELTHGLMANSTISNLCSNGLGPRTVYMGRTACIIKSDFMAWLKEHYGRQSGLFGNLVDQSSRKVQKDAGESAEPRAAGERTGAGGRTLFEEPSIVDYE